MRKLTALVTAGPTQESIDPVRFISNHSSGKQGYAIANALAGKGVDVVLVSGPVSDNLIVNNNIKVIDVKTAEQMLQSCEGMLPVDIAIFTAAVCDWRPGVIHTNKIKKKDGQDSLDISFVKNPDILKTISNHSKRPRLVIGFAAETENLVNNAKQKLKQKSCDWILANDVSEDKVFGSDNNKVTLLTHNIQENWDKSSKDEIAERLVQNIFAFFKDSV